MVCPIWGTEGSHCGWGTMGNREMAQYGPGQGPDYEGFVNQAEEYRFYPRERELTVYIVNSCWIYNFFSRMRDITIF